MRAIFVVAATLTFAACGSRAQTPAPAAASDAPAAVRAVERVEALAAAVDDSDCDTYAARVDAWLADDAAEVARLTRQSREQPVVDAGTLEPRLTAAFEVVIRGARQCPDHAAAAAAYRGFERFVAES